MLETDNLSRSIKNRKRNTNTTQKYRKEKTNIYSTSGRSCSPILSDPGFNWNISSTLLENTLIDACPRVIAEIDLQAISSNFDKLNGIAQKKLCKVLPVIKANAYGYGAVPVAQCLYKNNNVDGLCVATLDEAIQLRTNHIPEKVDILVLGPTHISEYPYYSQYNLGLTIDSIESGKNIIDWAIKSYQNDKLVKPLKIHIILNTGMSRIGLETYIPNEDIACKESVKIIKKLYNTDNNIIELCSIFTHLASCTGSSDIECNNFTQSQYNRILKIVQDSRKLGVSIPMIHIENSQSLLVDNITTNQIQLLMEGNPDQSISKIYCRVGGGLYAQRDFLFLSPTITLKAQLRNIHFVKKGTKVGYDGVWSAVKDTYIGTLSIGFADGLSRYYSSNNINGYVYINGIKCPIVGKVCMDMIMIDCGFHKNKKKLGIKVGDYAIIYGNGGISLKQYASNINTALSEVTSSITNRVMRKYINVPQIVIQ